MHIRKKIIIIFVLLCLLSLTAITSYSRFTKKVTKTGTIATADVGYCQSKGITSFKECLIRNDSQQELSDALSTINTRTSSINLNSIEPVNTYVPKTTYTNITDKTNTSAITSTIENRFTYVIESKLITQFDLDDPDITKISFNPDTGYYTYTDASTGDINDIITTTTDMENGIYKYTCLNTKENGNCNELYLFNEAPYLVSSQYRFKQGYKYSYTVTGTSTSNSGLYKGEDDYTIYENSTAIDNFTYYYRGDVKNNWVKFGGFLWRIVRINGDGSIRLVYSGLASSSNHTGTNAQIKTSIYGDNETFTTTTTDLYDSSQTVTTTYSNGRYGNTNVGYMYNPAKTLNVYPNRNPSTSSNLEKFPTFTNINSAANYYFFKNFDLSTDCFTGNDSDESGACTLKCRSLGNDGDSGIDCVYSNWNTLATTTGNYSTTASGSTSSQFIYQKSNTDGGYRYTCWGYGTPVTKSNGDGTTSVYITCPVVSEIVGTVKNQPTQAKVKYQGLFLSNAQTANTNVKDSKIKTEVDNWYATYILNANDDNGNNLEDYLSDEIFCNDRSSISNDFPLVNNNSYVYKPNTRNLSSKTPSFKCSNNDGTFNSNDAFTLKTSNTISSVTASGDGNSKLTYPVGLITIDEAAYAGGIRNIMNFKSYLYTGEIYWTLSPSIFSSNYFIPLVWIIRSDGRLDQILVSGSYGVRPVINLNSDVLYSSGSGTEEDPYEVKLKDYCKRNNISNFSECLIRSDSKDTLSNSLANIDTRTANVDFTVTEPNGNNSNPGLYKGEDDYTTYENNVATDNFTYYYRGDVKNNWVDFGGFYWRIIRINGDGSVRMIYSGLKNSNHTGTNAQIKTSAYGDTETFTTTTTDLYDSSKTVTTTYSNGVYGNTNVGYMYNPSKIISVYPNRNPSFSYNLTTFPHFTNIDNTKNYYFFKNFDPSTDCFTGTGTDDSGACTLKCRTLGNDGDSGIDCVYSNWNTLATTTGNYSTTADGSTSTNFIFQKSSTDGGYRYTCWGYGTPVTKSNGDGTTSVYITCPVVSEIVGTINNQPTQARVKYHGLFSADAATANTNVKDSKAKSEVDSWYASNILNGNDGNGIDLEDYLSDEIFCNDRTSTSNDFPLDNDNAYRYGTHLRNYSSKTPSFKCLKTDGTFNTNDAFTLKTTDTISSVTASGDGNNKLTYPVGLITLDESVYAGGLFFTGNNKYYLYTGVPYWTMSPSIYHVVNLYAYITHVSLEGQLSNTQGTINYGVRPVINLSGDVLYSGGSGTEDNPFKVTLASE